MKISGESRNLLIGLMLTTMVASMLMSNTATTAMVIAAIMPLLMSLGRGSGFAKALLLGIPIAAATGGMGTIIGTPPNAIAVGALENAGISIDFIDWMKYGFPIAFVLTRSLPCSSVFVRPGPISLAFARKPDEHVTRVCPTAPDVVGLILVTVGCG
jgi:sodium-dependent dicarboxylate transporter 2/3/5